MPSLLDMDFDAKKIVLDMHDVSGAPEFTKERLAKVDKIFVKTDYHRSLYPDVPDEKFVIVGNGIDLARFEGEEKRHPHRFIYSSGPSRGLDYILYMWPEIREALPDAELHVFYGWESFYELEKGNPERMEWMRMVQNMMKQEGVFDHGRVGQKELAREMMKASYWIYPTDFPEIHCITALEMQAAGVYPLTTGYAALEETQKFGLKMPGDPKDEAWRQKFTEAVVQCVKENKDTNKTANKIKKLATEFSWDDVANTWNNELQ
jgi:glycosyltransferase involved in cell wall biosynthesis